MAFCFCALALALMAYFVVDGVQRETVRIMGPAGRPCVGTVWMPRTPKAVLLLGHGVTENQGIMATAANAFALNGYAVVAFDFWGHGRSRERFDWSSNAQQLNVWCDWARERFPGLHLAYLGHSMGGEAGDSAFREHPKADAFVSMGMLPRKMPACKTLIAMGRYEELFSADQAHNLARNAAEVLISPFSDHVTEPSDSVLLRGSVAWLNSLFNLDSPVVFPAGRFTLMLLAVLLGSLSALALAVLASSIGARPAQPSPAAPPGRFNAFRVAAWALRCRGDAMPPRSSGFAEAAVRGVVFGVVLAALMSLLLNANVFTCRLDHPERLVTWLGLALAMSALFLLTARALERIPLHGAYARFAVGALTRATPLFAAGIILELAGPGIAFAGMMFCILGLVFVFISAVHALVTRSTGDYRAGAVACGVTLAWITAFWLPLMWSLG